MTQLSNFKPYLFKTCLPKTCHFKPRLIIMAKYPSLGRVKTRLGRDIGAVEATRFYRHNLMALLHRFQTETRWDTTVAIAPDQAARHFENQFSIPVIGQGRGDLGQRMQSIFRHQPAGPVIIIGSDIPNISGNEIAQAFQKLGRSDMVIGAGEDGGYWLIGMKRTPKVLNDIFNNVAWSSDQTFADTMRNMSGYKVSFLQALNDIDDGQDYVRWQQEGAIY